MSKIPEPSEEIPQPTPAGKAQPKPVKLVFDMGARKPQKTTDDNWRRSAQALAEGEALLICSGAGMGVDCGLGTFRGRNAGVWPPMKTLGLDYTDICTPVWFEDDARLGWAFWHFCYSAYSQGTPHKGYQILADFGRDMKYGFFSATSNIDGHWVRTKGVGEERVYECHGAVTHMQRVDDARSIWLSDADEIQRLAPPAWDLSAGEQVEVLEGSLAHSRFDLRHRDWVPGSVAADGCSILSPEGKELSVAAVRRPGGDDLARVPEHAQLPVCPDSGAPARPNVLMFTDWKTCDTRIEEQQARMDAWMDALPSQARLVVVEVGAGTTVPTMRYVAESAAARFPNGTLLRINLDEASVPPRLQERAIGLGGRGALEALEQLRELCSASGRERGGNLKAVGEAVGAKGEREGLDQTEACRSSTKVELENGLGSPQAQRPDQRAREQADATREGGGEPGRTASGGAATGGPGTQAGSSLAGSGSESRSGPGRAHADGGDVLSLRQVREALLEEEEDRASTSSR